MLQNKQICYQHSCGKPENNSAWTGFCHYSLIVLCRCLGLLSDFFKIRTIMTGTPVANRPYDIWAQIYFLDKGKSLGSDFLEFKRYTDLSNKLGNDREAREMFELTVASIFEKIIIFYI